MAKDDKTLEELPAPSMKEDVGFVEVSFKVPMAAFKEHLGNTDLTRPRDRMLRLGSDPRNYMGLISVYAEWMLRDNAAALLDLAIDHHPELRVKVMASPTYSAMPAARALQRAEMDRFESVRIQHDIDNNERTSPITMEADNTDPFALPVSRLRRKR